MFASEAVRLIRQKWRSPNALAQELFAILTTTNDMPMSHDAPLKLTQLDPNSTDPTLNIRNFGSLDAPAIRIDRKNGQRLEIGTDGSQTTITPDPDDPDNEVKKKREQKPVVSLGKIAGGSGSRYQVDLYDDPSGTKATSRVTVEQMLIAAGETIPVGTPTTVFKIGSKYYMQVPVWQ